MEIFPAIYFSYSTTYPQSGVRIQMGRSYQFDAPPEAPDQRTFKLTVQGMQYFLDMNGNLDPVVNPDRNMAGLEAFYNRHKTYKNFILPHPVYGQVVCKFQDPLKVPEGNPGGGGTLPSIEVELIEIP